MRRTHFLVVIVAALSGAGCGFLTKSDGPAGPSGQEAQAKVEPQRGPDTPEGEITPIPVAQVPATVMDVARGRMKGVTFEKAEESRGSKYTLPDYILQGRDAHDEKCEISIREDGVVASIQNGPVPLDQVPDSVMQEARRKLPKAKFDRAYGTIRGKLLGQQLFRDTFKLMGPDSGGKVLSVTIKVPKPS